MSKDRNSLNPFREPSSRPLSLHRSMPYETIMAQRKRPELTSNFVTGVARPRRATVARLRAAPVFQIPPEHLEGIRAGLAQIERGEISDEAEVEALLAPDRP